MSRLTRDGTAEPVSRDQILRCERGQGNIHFPCSADHESRIGDLTRLIHTLTIHTDSISNRACGFPGVLKWFGGECNDIMCIKYCNNQCIILKMSVFLLSY